MSWIKKISRYLLYHQPQPSPVLFEAGIEDRGSGVVPGKGGAAGEKGSPSEDTNEQRERATAGGGKKTTGTCAGGSASRKKYRAGRRTGGSRKNDTKTKQNNAVLEKYAQRVEENREIDDILNSKVELSYNLEENQKILKKLFRVPQNKDAVFRSLTIGTEPPVRALLVFIDGITDAQVQNIAILQPLMLLSGARDIRQNRKGGTPAETGVFLQGQECSLLGSGGGSDDQVNQHPVYKDFFDRVKQAVLPNNQVAEARTYEQVVYDILNGNSALFIEGYNQALLLETKGWHFRSVTHPQVEAVIRGPQEAFTEMLRVNTSLVRKIIHRPSLVTEFIKVGSAAPMQCAVMYLADLVNPDLLQEVKRRLEAVKADFTQETGLVEQMIEDNPSHMVPQILTTERPDRVAASLLEGRVAVLVDGNPFVMIMPCTFFSLMQAPEDAYVRWPFGSLMRFVRYAGLFMALLLPAHYVAIVAYHQEFIPTDLLMVITGSREKVPFPSIVEVLIMEAAFELIREAGIRIPGTIGTTLGIVGALILGQAAVAANIVSPILIIVVAVTALGSFAIPNYSFSLTIRLLRFVYILFASLSGLLGILVGFFIHVGIMTTVKSFGVPFLAPLAPVTQQGSDYLMRGPAWEQKTRPDVLDPLKKRRQPRLSRGWLQRRDGEGGQGRK